MSYTGVCNLCGECVATCFTRTREALTFPGHCVNMRHMTEPQPDARGITPQEAAPLYERQGRIGLSGPNTLSLTIELFHDLDTAERLLSTYGGRIMGNKRKATFKVIGPKAIEMLQAILPHLTKQSLVSEAHELLRVIRVPTSWSVSQ